MLKLDLHGCNYKDVTSKVIRFIEDNWSSANDIEIITGNSLSMKELVTGILDEYKLEYRIGDLLKINMGYITILNS